MTDIERLEDRLTAVERAVVDGDHDFEDLAELAEVVDRLERIETQLSSIEKRVADLEGRTESVEGYVANVDSVNETVEQQAASAVSAVEALDERVEALERGQDTPENVDQFRPSASGGNGASEHVDDDSVDRRVDEIVAGTDREQSLGGTDSASAPPARDGGAAAPSDARSSNGQGQPPAADPETVKNRYGGGPGRTPATAESDADADAGTEAEDDGFLASLKSKLP